MKKASIAFTVIAFVLAGCTIIGIIANPQIRQPEYLPYMCLIGAGFYTIFGLIAHILAIRYRAKNGGGLLAVYILTFPAYLVPFILLFALWLVLKFIDIMLDLFTDGKVSLASATKFLYEAAFGKPKSKTVASSDVYVVIDGGYERELAFIEQREDHDPDSPLYTKYYNRFRDNVGNYWRSYDSNQTFIKETIEQTSRGY